MTFVIHVHPNIFYIHKMYCSSSYMYHTGAFSTCHPHVNSQHINIQVHMHVIVYVIDVHFSTHVHHTNMKILNTWHTSKYPCADIHPLIHSWKYQITKDYLIYYGSIVTCRQFLLEITQPAKAASAIISIMATKEYCHKSKSRITICTN